MDQAHDVRAAGYRSHRQPPPPKEKAMGEPTTVEGLPPRTRAALDLVEAHSAHNYAPLPVVLTEGEGAWVRDVDGRRYLDLLAAYGALNFGHRHPRLTAVAHAQLDRLTLT